MFKRISCRHENTGTYRSFLTMLTATRFFLVEGVPPPPNAARQGEESGHTAVTTMRHSGTDAAGDGRAVHTYSHQDSGVYVALPLVIGRKLHSSRGRAVPVCLLGPFESTSRALRKGKKGMFPGSGGNIEA